MKKLYILSLLSISGAIFAQAGAFTGTVGTPINANGWQTHSGIAAQMLTTAGSLNYSGLTSVGGKTQLISTNTEDVNLSGFTPITTQAYYSGLINLPNVTSLSASTTNGSYFLMVAATASPATVTVFNARIYIRAGVTADTFNLGILNGAGGTASPTYSTIDYPINTTHFVVVKFDFATNTASLWVNPAIGSAQGTPTVTNNTGTTVAPTQTASLVIREATGTGNIDIDELRISDSWAAVTSGALKNNKSEIAGLSIYPNPVTNGTLNINSDANAERTISIYDVIGKQVLNTKTSESAINVSSLNAGIYMVQITEEGKTATRKLVIR